MGMLKDHLEWSLDTVKNLTGVDMKKLIKEL